MAQYTHLPIYKTTYDLLNLVTKKIKKYYSKFGIKFNSKLTKVLKQ
jgi:hypothetical protein